VKYFPFLLKCANLLGGRNTPVGIATPYRPNGPEFELTPVAARISGPIHTGRKTTLPSV